MYLLKDMTNGHCIPGPAIIIEKNRHVLFPTFLYYNQATMYVMLIRVLVLHSTIVVEPSCTATITEYGDVEIMVCNITCIQCMLRHRWGNLYASQVMVNTMEI